mgnify:FL=1
MADKTLTVRIKVTGRVQGVGFRYFSSRLAAKYGIIGAARNEIDGTVTVIATGEEAVFNKFLAELAKGPAMGRVDKMERISIVLSDFDLSTFDIVF